MQGPSTVRDVITGTDALDADPNVAQDTQCLTKDDVATAVDELLRARLDASAWQDAVRDVSVCGMRATVQLALQVSGAAELIELDAAVTRRLKELGATDVEVVVRRPETSPASRLSPSIRKTRARRCATNSPKQNLPQCLSKTATAEIR